MRSPLIFVSAGEASGDHYGADLIAGVRAALPEARFTGLGGVGMEAAGQRRVVRAEDVAVMGITEILRHVPRIVRSYRALVRSIKDEPPDVAVLIDFPDVNFRLAKHLKWIGVPVVWFVSPQLWAWKRRRLRWVQQRVSTMLTIFPFEEEFYRNRGVRAEFVGHPLAEAALPTVSREEFARQPEVWEQNQYRLSLYPVRSHPQPYWMRETDPAKLRYVLDVAKPWIALLPGSRRGETAAHLGTMVQAAKLLGNAYEYLIPVAPGIGDDHLKRMEELVRAYLHAEPVPRITFVRDARAALRHSRAAVVASGTATVQAAVMGTPFVAVYRVSKTTFALAKRLVRYPAEMEWDTDASGNLPIAMVNLVAGRRVVPELLQGQFTEENVEAALRPLLEDGPARRAQLEGLARVRGRLLRADGVRSMERLRDAVLDALNTGRGAASSVAAVSASND